MTDNNPFSIDNRQQKMQSPEEIGSTLKVTALPTYMLALTVLLLQTGGTINGACAVNKSFPDFFDRLTQLGAELEYEGMPSGEGD